MFKDYLLISAVFCNVFNTKSSSNNLFNAFEAILHWMRSDRLPFFFGAFLFIANNSVASARQYSLGKSAREIIHQAT
jgi:hypothetical protein